VVSLTSSSGGYINGRNSANLELLIDKTSSIYLYVKLKALPSWIFLSFTSFWRNSDSYDWKLCELFLLSGFLICHAVGWYMSWKIKGFDGGYLRERSWFKVIQKIFRVFQNPHVIYATTRENSFTIFLLSLFYCRQNLCQVNRQFFRRTSWWSRYVPFFVWCLIEFRYPI
jgi:hypothetical protein